MSNKNFKNQNHRNYNQYANKQEPDQAKKETIKEVIEPVEETVEEIIEPAEETVEEMTEAEEETTEANFGKVNCSKLNVRKGPSINSNPLCIVEYGTRMETSEFNSEWIKVLTQDGTSGYCMRKFVDLD